MTRRASRVVALWALAALCLAGGAVPGASGPAVAATTTGGSGASVSKTITRTHLVGGADELTEARTVTMTVDQTHDLRSRQSVGVAWRGAHPTGNAQADITSPSGLNDEFPFVLLQCRGVDSPTAPVSEQLTPQTCWTQTANERIDTAPSNPFPAWRVDRYAATSERTFHVNDPPLPNSCDTHLADGVRRVPFVSATATTYYPDGGTGAGSICTAQPPEQVIEDNAAQPGNTTYGITRLDGKGATKFTMWSAEDNASLGCSQTVKCALVAVPVLGVSCDVAAAALPTADRPPASIAERVANDCLSTGNYGTGVTGGGQPPAPSVTGRLWWTASNWRNRLTVPLTFAPADNVCDVVGAKEPVDLYGSELMTQAMTQWRPAFCLDAKRTPFRHVQTGEPQAASLLAQSSIEAGLVSHPPDGGYGKPVVNAPVAFSGFAVGYVIDDEQQGPYTKLRLTPRLIAKLLTMSYPGLQLVKDEYVALQHNPLDISSDPEFQALNPGIKKGVPDSIAASTIFSLSSDSDVIRSLTTYLTSDKETRAWLDGAADPWGMTVNPSYRKIALPVQTWPQLDTFEPKKYYARGDNGNICLTTSPVPYLPLIAAPTIRMSNISLAMQFAVSPSQTGCDQPGGVGSIIGLKLKAKGREFPGSRFLLGLTSLGDAARYDLDTAALQTTVAAGTATKFTSDAGRTFVAPTDNGLRAAANLLTANTKTGVWDLPMSRVVKDAAAKAAYPGSMVVYAAVPTTGLSAAGAKAYAALLTWMATTGQSPGTTNGTLARGFLPMTAANGLQPLASFTTRAASAVAAQQGAVPSMLASPSTRRTTGAPGPGATADTGGPLGSGSSGGSVGSGGPLGSGGSGAAPVTPPSTQPTAAPKPPAGPAIIAAKAPQRIATVAQEIGIAGALARWLLLGALVLGGAVPLALGLRELWGRRG